jgi:hypothetical protein
MFTPFNPSLIRKPMFGLIAILAGGLALMLAAGPAAATMFEIPSATSPEGAHAS